MKKPIPLKGKIFMTVIYLAIIGLAVWYFVDGDILTFVGYFILAVIVVYLSERKEKKERGRLMKIGLDIHGVCDANPEFFVKLSQLFVKQGHEVHILTGRRVSDGALEEIEELGLSYTHFFSISDYHQENGTKMWEDENGNPWLDGEEWDRTKGDYCKEHNIDFCIDDTERYGKYFETPFAFIKIKKDEK